MLDQAELHQAMQQVAEAGYGVIVYMRQEGRGIGLLNSSINRLDEATQHNAALVEEMDAAAGSLNAQAQDLVQAVSVFKLPA